MLKRRQDYQPPAFLVTSVFITIDIKDDATNVTTKLAVRRNPDAAADAPLWLDGQNIELMRLVIDSADLPVGQDMPDGVSLSDHGLSVAGLADEAVVEVQSRCYPQDNTALEGLYLSGGMYCTQCEPEGFRRIGYFPDRPDVMSVFTVRIEASTAFPQILSNGNLIETGSVSADRHFAVWHDPHPKPSYLFAVVVGDLDCVTSPYVTASGRAVDLKIYVEKGNANLTAHAMDSLIRSMRWDEQEYGLEYDLDLFQIVAVSHFNMGAMENKGLNIFNSKFVLADKATATDDDLHRVESIVAHEYFHNWTGNRVTCRDWFQLTLKEGLTVFRDQCFSADMHDAGVQRANDVALLRAAQFPEDRGPTAHPIRPETYKEVNNFYTATVYEKGAEVIRMLAGFLGKDGFRKGTDLYFARHDGHAVTCDDFLAAMADANNVNLDGFQGWYRQAGTPQLRVRRHAGDDVGHLMLSLSQQSPDTAAQTPRHALPISIRLAFLDQQGKIVSTKLAANAPAQDEHVILLTDEHLEQTIFAPQAAHLTPSILRNFSAPVVVDDDLSLDERRHIMRYDTDLFNRWDSAQTLVSDEILAIAADPQAAVNTDRIAALADGVSHILDDPNCLDYFKAAILALPAISVLESRMTPADPVALFNARLAFEAALARQMPGHYQAALDPKKSAQLADTAGGRALLNRLLALAVAAGDARADECAMAHVLDSNMTVSQGALAAVNNRPTAVRETVLSAFHDRWQDNALVLEKWFSFESMSCISGHIERLQELMQHPAFDPKNPNKLRVVLGAFMAGNSVRFYAEDGSGFEFIAGCLIDIDKRNPQLAARMALPLTRIGAYSEQRQQQMRTVLETLQAAAQSNDLSEVIEKALV
ncbi:aminopeptidase N [Alphaproteobacteria bacterium]|nr:aminopeptidase N [Alphaproteobacteria bacterium]